MANTRAKIGILTLPLWGNYGPFSAVIQAGQNISDRMAIAVIREW